MMYIKDNIKNIDFKKVILQCIAIFITIFLMLTIQNNIKHELLIASYGATCVILFCFPESNFAKPQNTIGGYIICSLTGLVIYILFGNGSFGLALAVSLSILIMMLSRLVHPPSAAATIIVVLRGADWYFVLTTVIFGAVLVVLTSMLFAKVYNKLNYKEKNDITIESKQA